MNLVTFPGRPLKGRISLPGDKSIAHRAALFAALADGESLIRNFPSSGVSQVMLSALTALQVPWRLNGDELWVNGRGLRGLSAPKQVIDCGNSATVLRLLAGVLAAAGVPATLDGSLGLRRRPMGRIVRPLKEMGVKIDAGVRFADAVYPEDAVLPAGRVKPEEQDHPVGEHHLTAPLNLAGRTPESKLRAIDTRLEIASAQVKTCLLLAALAADGVSIIQEPDISRDHTERLLREMGVNLLSERLVSDNSHCVKLTPVSSLYLNPLSLSIPGDISSAAFLIVSALVTPGSEVIVEGVLLNPTRTGLLEVLRSMGADLTIVFQGIEKGEPIGDVVARYSSLRGVQIPGNMVVSMIDEFPAFSIAAAYAEGISTVSGAAELRNKESDRISMLCGELRALGVQAEESPDGFTIQGKRSVPPGQVNAHGDHRLAMAFSIAGLAAAGPIKVKGAEIISESFPDFVPTLQLLGGELAQEEHSIAR